MRILVTGSRDWEDRLTIYRQLENICIEFDLNFTPDKYGNTMPDSRKFTLVHGHCPTGADHWADQWCISNYFEPERYPADWKKLGKPAGFIRNSHMVKLGADVCLAFLMPCSKHDCPNPKPHDSHGGSMTMNLAIKADIETRVFRNDSAG